MAVFRMANQVAGLSSFFSKTRYDHGKGRRLPASRTPAHPGASAILARAPGVRRRDALANGAPGLVASLVPPLAGPAPGSVAATARISSAVPSVADWYR